EAERRFAGAQEMRAALIAAVPTAAEPLAGSMIAGLVGPELWKEHGATPARFDSNSLPDFHSPGESFLEWSGPNAVRRADRTEAAPTLPGTFGGTELTAERSDPSGTARQVSIRRLSPQRSRAVAG